jgi:hypothetical protein
MQIFEVLRQKEKPGGSRQEPTATSPKMEIAKTSEVSAAGCQRKPAADSRKPAKGKEH